MHQSENGIKARKVRQLNVTFVLFLLCRNITNRLSYIVGFLLHSYNNKCTFFLCTGAEIDRLYASWLDQQNKNPEKNYIESRRGEREAEFAPPQVYFQTDNKQQNKNRHPAKRDKKDLFSKLDAMETLDKSHSGDRQAEYGPPSDYFTVPVKKPKSNPMASLEKETNANNSVGDVVSLGLSSIRAEMEGIRVPGPGTGLDISNIPLPAERTAKENFDGNSDYQQHEMQFYHGQYVLPPHHTHYPPPYPMPNAVPNMTVPPPPQPPPPGTDDTQIHYHSNTAQLLDVGSGNYSNETMATEKQLSKSTQQTSSLKQTPPIGIISAAPMLYDRAGSRVGAPVKPRYERVHLHKVPLTLPAPPSVRNMPLYPSQEDVHEIKRDKQEKDTVKHWFKQYSDNKPKASTSNIPFPSPYVQSEPKKSDLFETAGFDPSKPPPNISDQNKG